MNQDGDGKVEAQWRFGLHERGVIALWCSVPLQPHDDVLTGRELRAPGPVSAWVVLCGDLTDYGSLEAFARECRKREPRFEQAGYTLHMTETVATQWLE